MSITFLMKAQVALEKRIEEKGEGMSSAPADSLREALHQETKSQEKIVTPQSLMEQYLLGKLTEGELAFELKKLNTITADNIIKEGKNSTVSPMQFKETARANMGNPGADLNPNEAQETAKPTTASEAKKAARNTDDKKLKQELQEKEQKLQEQQNTQRVTEILNFVQDGKKQKEKGEQYRDKVLKEKTEEKQLEKDSEENAQLEVSASSRLRSYLAAKLKKIPSITKIIQKHKGGATGQGR